VALIAGGHSFGKTHGAGDPSLVGADPESGALEDQGLGWKSKHGTGIGADAITGGPEVHLDADADQMDAITSSRTCLKTNGSSPKVRPEPNSGRRKGAQATIPDAYDKSKKHVPTMLTTDLSLRLDPAYEEDLAALLRASRPVRRRVRAGVVQAHAPRHGSARALSRKLVPKETLIWQDPIPAVDHKPINGQGYRGPEGEARRRPVGAANWSRPPGRRPRHSADRTSVAAPTARAFASARRRIGT